MRLFPTLRLIAGVSRDRRTLDPTPSRQDLQRFQALTIGRTCLVGRTTWELLPPAARRDRNWIVVSSEPISGQRVIDSELFRETPLEAVTAVASACGVDDLWVCGGGLVYRTLLPFCQYLYLSTSHIRQGQVPFPEVNLDGTGDYQRLCHQYGDDHTFEIYRRR